jgi:N utilization substance protein B
MANRHLSRSIVLQTLFEWDFAVTTDSPEEMLERNIEEFGPGLDDEAFMSDLFIGVVKKKEIINEIIEKAAPDWPLDKISVVDRNILRIGLYELLFSDRTQVPPKVAINEAIELAKSFGGENSSKFINGVLGGVYKEIGEPGKDDVGKKHHKHFETDPAKFPIEKKAGAVVYAYKDGEVYFAFVHDVFGYWTICKDGLTEAEKEEDGAIRAVKEKTGLDIKIKELLGSNEYIASHPEKGKIKKQATFFLGESEYKDIVLEKGTGGLDDANWFPFGEVPNLKMYDNMIPLLTKTIEILNKK